MKFLIVFLFFSFLFASELNGQEKTALIANRNNLFDFKLNNDMPSVYVTFEKYEKLYSEKTNQTLEIVWLRVHNNFKGDITFCSYDTSVSPTGKIVLNYIAEKTLDFADLSTRNNESIPLGMPGFDICNEYGLKSGNSFLFGVYQKDLTKDRSIKIQFVYPWEDAFDARTGNEPNHFVPKNLK